MAYISIIIAFFTSLISTWFIKEICLNHGIVEIPQKDRWSNRSVAKFGGIAIFISIFLSLLLMKEINTFVYFILIGSSVIFLLGFLDDIFSVSPSVKFFIQMLIGVLSYYYGFKFFHISPTYISFPLTILWYVGIINSINLLDNMDGLSSGITAIISLIIGISALLSQNFILVELSFIVMAACIGFLVYNFNPAKIFMGDCGSMLLGFLLAAISLLATNYSASNLAITLFLPLMFMAIPIFDTSFVTLSRLFNKRKISVGGKDHSSHRLVQLGLSERKAVFFIYIICLFIGFSALAFQVFNIQLWYSGIVLIVISLFFLGLFLSKISVYEDESEISKSGSKFSLNWETHKNTFSPAAKQGFEIIVDIILITFSYTVAYILRYETGIQSAQWDLFSITLPIIIIIQLISLFIFSVHGGVWQYIGIPNLLNILKSIIVSGIILFIYFELIINPAPYSQSLLIIHLMMSCLLLCASRLSYRLINIFFFQESNKINLTNVLIYGAGSGGDEIVRSIINNPAHKYNIVGFIDDDKRKKNLTIFGVPILGTRDDLSILIKKKNVEEIIISIQAATEKQMEEIYSICGRLGISVKKAKWQIEKLKNNIN